MRQKPTQATIYIVLTPARRALGRAEAGCESGARLCRCCCPFDASTTSLTSQSLTAVPGLVGAAAAPPSSRSASVFVHGRSHRARLQSLFQCPCPAVLGWPRAGDRWHWAGRRCRGTAAHLPHGAAPSCRAVPGLRERGRVCAGAAAGPGSLPSRPFPEPSTTAHSPRRFYPSPRVVNGQASARRISPAFAGESLPGAAGAAVPEQRPQRKPARGFAANGAAARLATGPLQHPSEESHCPHAIKMQFAVRKPLRPHAPKCSVLLDSPPPQESRQPPLAGKSIFYKSHNGPLAFNQVLGVGSSLPVGQSLRRK